MWKPYRTLNRDPFLEPGSAYVALPGHEEAIARLAHTIETRQPLGTLRAGVGLGKTRIMKRILVESRRPDRRFSMVCRPTDGAALFAGLAERLGTSLVTSISRSTGWRALERAVQVCGLQGFQVVLAIDDAHTLSDRRDREDLERLGHLQSSGPGVTIIQSLIDDPEEARETSDWGRGLSVGLKPLMRSEVETYIAAKLAAAGSRDMIFTARALTRLQALTRGIPREIDRLASLCLMAGASRGSEAITSKIVDEVGRECMHAVNPCLFRST